MRDKIRNWCSDTFVDRNAAKWATAWLCTFFAATNAFETIKGITDVFSDFNGNEFYIENKKVLYELCGHAAQSYAECAPSMSVEAEGDWTIGGITQVLEPVIMAARLEGVVDARKSLVALIKSAGAQA